MSDSESKPSTETAVHGDVLPLWKDHLRHMLGAASRVPGYRNFFCAILNSEDYQIMLDMQASGLVEAGKRINSGRDQLFHATTKGIVSIGIFKEQRNGSVGA